MPWVGDRHLRTIRPNSKHSHKPRLDFWVSHKVTRQDYCQLRGNAHEHCLRDSKDVGLSHGWIPTLNIPSSARLNFIHDLWEPDAFWAALWRPAQHATGKLRRIRTSATATAATITRATIWHTVLDAARFYAVPVRDAVAAWFISWN